jgi:hypothetical protein
LPQRADEEGDVSTNVTIAALAAVCALGATACEATITPQTGVVASGGLVARVTTVPVDIYTYPRVVFGGSYVYLVNGFWYRPTSSGWVVYRQEPAPLARARVRIYASPRTPGPRGPEFGSPAPAPPPIEEPYEFGRQRTPNPP